jgi:metal-responsive CopG/Arc/MetJ family transcriptional regulator
MEVKKMTFSATQADLDRLDRVKEKYGYPSRSETIRRLAENALRRSL